MKADKGTREKLIASAKAEFMEKGYAKASLRKICANAGVTTGALYFFFQDKEDLFAAIVEKPAAELLKIMHNHFQEDERTLSDPNVYEYQKGDHDDIAELLVRHLYANYDAFLLLLTKAQGTRFEHVLDQIVEVTEKNYLQTAKSMVAQMPETEVNEYMGHWMAHISIDAFVHLLTHKLDEKEALLHSRMMMDYIVKGWMEMVLVGKN